MWLKDQDYVALAYMTGILPVKKYGSHSALNMITEYSMTNPRDLAEFFGFTEEEVQKLCLRYKRSFEETCLIPRKAHIDKPAVVIELKWDSSAYGALAQIKERNYTESLKDYQGDLILAGINYDRKNKTHTCIIEKMEKRP